MNKPQEFDASKYVIGRLAVKVSSILQGKDDPSYRPNVCPKITVKVYNTDLIKYTGNKAQGKIYYRHTGYPGHLRKRTLGEQLERDSREVIKKAVYNMLPKNKLRASMMRNLKLYKEEIK